MTTIILQLSPATLVGDLAGSGPLAEALRALVLGVVQGLTEFLPISSSGHLILFSKFAGWPDQGLAFDIAANTGTLAALVLYFRRDLLKIVRGGAAGLKATSSGGELPLLLWLLIATVPVAAAGLLAADWVAEEGRNPRLIAITSIMFGILLWIADRKAKHADSLEGARSPLRALSESGDDDGGDEASFRARLSLKDAVAMGIAQAIALVPGTSRSGAVMTAGLFRSFDRTSAARLAFLMAIPVGILVAAKNAIDLLATSESVAWGAMGIGFVSAAVCGYLVIALLLEWLKHRGLGPFVLYRIALGVALLILA